MLGRGLGNSVLGLESPMPYETCEVDGKFVVQVIVALSGDIVTAVIAEIDKELDILTVIVDFTVVPFSSVPIADN